MLIFIANIAVFRIAGAIWFLIKILIELLSIFVIVYKSEVDIRVLIDIIFLSCLQSFDLLVNVLRFKLDWIKLLIKNLAFYFNWLIYKSLAINNYFVFGTQV